MARKTVTYTVEDEGRDKGKSFLLTEMSAAKAEAWAIRALLALGSANVDIPADSMNDGMASLAAIGLKKLFALPFGAAAPLLDELMECVQVVPDSRRPQVKRGLVDSDIEEVRTRLQIKWEVLKLHLDLSLADALSNLREKTPAEGEKPQRGTRTSHKESE